MAKTVTSITIDERLKNLVLESKKFRSETLSSRIEEALVLFLKSKEEVLNVSNKKNIQNTLRGTKESSGIDIKLLEDVIIKPGLNIIDLKTSFEIPSGHFGMLKLRSSIAKKGIFEYSGVIDSDYRADCKIIVFNLIDTNFVFEAGERIAQLVIIPFLDANVQFKETLSETERTGGFGSIGV